ncbi:MAG: hypothetical protein RLZZ505_29 [Verrucomicrobiota bacterium]
MLGSSLKFMDCLGDNMQVFGSASLGRLRFVNGALSVQLSPKLGIKSLSVPVRVTLTDHWIDFLPQITVMSAFSWLKADIDWHVYSNRRVCFELDCRWTEHFEALRCNGLVDLEHLAAQWLTRSTAYILHVHYTCAKLGIEEWPEDLAPAWPHGKPAIDLYNREKSKTRR